MTDHTPLYRRALLTGALALSLVSVIISIPVHAEFKGVTWMKGVTQLRPQWHDMPDGTREWSTGQRIPGGAWSTAIRFKGPGAYEANRQFFSLLYSAYEIGGAPLQAPNTDDLPPPLVIR